MHSCGYNQVRDSVAGLSAELHLGVRKKKKKTQPKLTPLCFQEPAATTERLWELGGEHCRGKRGGGWGGGRGGAGIGRTFLLLFLFFFFAGSNRYDSICFQLPVEDDVSPLPVRYVLHMQTPKHPGVSPLSSHPSFPSLPLSLPSSVESKAIPLHWSRG